jgi:hypothetical protein
LPHSIEIGERTNIENLLSELQLDESMILEEFGEFWPRVHTVLQTQSLEEAKSAIQAELTSIEERKRLVGKIAHEILSTF